MLPDILLGSGQPHLKDSPSLQCQPCWAGHRRGFSASDCVSQLSVQLGVVMWLVLANGVWTGVQCPHPGAGLLISAYTSFCFRRLEEENKAPGDSRATWGPKSVSPPEMLSLDCHGNKKWTVVFKTFIYSLIGGLLYHNVVLVSATHQHESATGIYIRPLPLEPPSHLPPDCSAVILCISWSLSDSHLVYPNYCGLVHGSSMIRTANIYWAYTIKQTLSCLNVRSHFIITPALWNRYYYYPCFTDKEANVQGSKQCM